MAAGKETLDSWKEIASYFDRTVRTVQNWESQGLPVVRDEQTGRVFAYVAELEEWRHKRLVRGRPAGRRRRIWVALASLAVLVLVVSAVGIGIWRRPDAEPGSAARPGLVEIGSTLGSPRLLDLGFRLELSSSHLLVSADNGQASWAISTRGLAVEYYRDYLINTDPVTRTGQRPILIRDLDGGEDVELLFVFKHLETKSPDELRCYSSDNSQLLWKKPFDRKMRVGNRSFEVHAGYVLAMVNDSNRDYILTWASDRSVYPSILTLWDPLTGDTIEEFWHPGRLIGFRLIDLDRDGLDELVFSGVNNPEHGDGHAAIGALKIPFSAAGSVSSDFFGNADAVRPFRYTLFPRPDAFPDGDLAIIRSIRVVSWDPEVNIQVDVGRDEFFITHILDSDLSTFEATPSNGLRRLHSSRERQLKHELTREEIAGWARSRSFDQVPDGNAPEIAASPTLLSWSAPSD